jgi:hypothetical protein
MRQRYGWRIRSVVVVVVDTVGRGVVVVVCSVVVVRIGGGGPPQAASITVPASIATPIGTPNREFALNIVRLPGFPLIGGQKCTDFWSGIAHQRSAKRRFWFEVSDSRASTWSRCDSRFSAIGY